MRALAAAMANNFHEVAVLRGMCEFSLQLVITARYESAIAVLSQYCDVDEYYIEYAAFVRECLDRFIANPIGSIPEKLRGVLTLSRDGLRIIDKCFESKSYSDIDVDAIAMRINILVSLFRFVVSIAPIPGSDVQGIPIIEIRELARNLSESIHAIISLAGDEQEVVETGIEAYDILIKYSAAFNDFNQLLYHCSQYLETLIASIKKHQPMGAAQFADLGDYLFCIGSTLVNYRYFFNELVAQSEGATGLMSCISAIDRVYADVASLAAANKVDTGHFEIGSGLLSVQSAPPYILLRSLRLYQIALQLWERQPETSESLTESQSGAMEEDIFAVNYNLICIGWMMGDEAMSKHYMSVCVHLIRRFYSDKCALKLDEFNNDIKNDRDLQGLSMTLWFEDAFRQQQGKKGDS